MLTLMTLKFAPLAASRPWPAELTARLPVKELRDAAESTKASPPEAMVLCATVLSLAPLSTRAAEPAGLAAYTPVIVFEEEPRSSTQPAEAPPALLVKVLRLSVLLLAPLAR